VNRRLQAFFTGTVQGVGFRYTTERTARRYAVAGFVRNLKDGRVEILAEGEEPELNEFLRSVRESSLKHYIRGVETQWGTATGEFERFEVTF